MVLIQSHFLISNLGIKTRYTRVVYFIEVADIMMVLEVADIMSEKYRGSQ